MGKLSNHVNGNDAIADEAYPRDIPPERKAHYASCSDCYEQLRHNGKGHVDRWKKEQLENVAHTKAQLTEVRKEWQDVDRRTRQRADTI